VVRLILMGILAFVGIRFIGSVVRYLREPSGGPDAEISQHGRATNDMMRDPVCGVYVSADQSLHTLSNGVRVYFCSEDCRSRFIAGRT
jgi:uncharacterized protein